MVGAIKMPSIPVNLKPYIPTHSQSKILTVISFGKLIMPFHLMFSTTAAHPFASNKFKRMAWSIRSVADGSSVNSSPTNGANGGTRLIRAFQALQFKIIGRLKELRKNLPVKLFFFLVGFYCATAFATVIGQTGDWDVLSAALAVVVVEGIGALMYKEKKLDAEKLCEGWVSRVTNAFSEVIEKKKWLRAFRFLRC